MCIVLQVAREGSSHPFFAGEGGRGGMVGAGGVKGGAVLTKVLGAGGSGGRAAEAEERPGERRRRGSRRNVFRCYPAEEGRNAPCPSSAGVLRVTPPRWAARACGRSRGGLAEGV